MTSCMPHRWLNAQNFNTDLVKYKRQSCHFDVATGGLSALYFEYIIDDLARDLTCTASSPRESVH